MTITVIYPGTFDPITRGHEDVITRAAAVFDNVIVAVAKAHHKITLFDEQERVALIQEVCTHLPNVKVLAFTGLLVDCVRAQGAQIVLRGMRSMSDYDFEVRLAGSNRILDPGIETLFMMPDTRFQHISSSIVREIARINGRVSGFVSDIVERAIVAKLSKQASI